MDKNILVLEYQDSFADNFSIYAYGKILENKFAFDCRYENTTSKRKNFENKMNNFALKYSYISKSRVEKIENQSRFIDFKDIHSKKIKSDKILNLNLFKIDDIEKITDDIKIMFDFNNLDFIVNYDILESITTSNSIGLYINSNDKPDVNYIEKATKRLNKYLKKPKLYIFSHHKLNLNSDIDYQILSLSDWREEFYFLKKCAHKIIHCSKNSYSEGFWASVLTKGKSYNYTLFSKELKPSKKFNNWIAI